MLTINKLEADQEVWIKNKTTGDFTINLRLDGGRVTEGIPIPKTWIPIRITAFAETKQLKACTDLRKAIARNMLELVSEEEAAKIINKPDAQAEVERLRKLEYSSTDFAETTEVTPMAVIKNIGSDKVKNVVRDTMLRSDLGDDEKLTLLISEEKSGNLEIDDYEYIIITSDSKSKIAKWADVTVKSLFG